MITDFGTASKVTRSNIVGVCCDCGTTVPFNRIKLD